MTLTPPGQTAGAIVTLRFDAVWEIHQFPVSGGILHAILGGCLAEMRRTTIYGRRRPGGYGLGESVRVSGSYSH